MFVSSIFLTLLVTCHCEIQISDRARNFSVELLYHTAEETQWHTVISPLGVWDLLTIVSLGATGNSKMQLRRALFLPTKKENFLVDYKNFTESVIRGPTDAEQFNVPLKSKNYIFVDKGLIIKKLFEQMFVNNLKVMVTRLPFSSTTEAADKANEIIMNSGVIEYDVFEPNDFNDAKMILTNLISFTAEWQSPFNASDTHVEPFHDEELNVIGQVNMMQQEAEFKFLNLNQINASVLRLPYGKEEKYSFLVVLPYGGVKLSNVYSTLATFSVTQILKKLDNSVKRFGMSSVNVKLPRFKISTNVILNKPLQNMGVVGIFEPWKRSFSKISDSTDLYVSAIVHKAEIRVTEIGTTASASTSAYLQARASPSKLNANRPFLYFIVEESTATIIFSGVYSKPTLF